MAESVERVTRMQQRLQSAQTEEQEARQVRFPFLRERASERPLSCSLSQARLREYTRKSIICDNILCDLCIAPDLQHSLPALEEEEDLFVFCWHHHLSLARLLALAGGGSGPGEPLALQPERSATAVAFLSHARRCRLRRRYR